MEKAFAFALTTATLTSLGVGLAIALAGNFVASEATIGESCEFGDHSIVAVADPFGLLVFGEFCLQVA